MCYRGFTHLLSYTYLFLQLYDILCSCRKAIGLRTVSGLLVCIVTVMIAKPRDDGFRAGDCVTAAYAASRCACVLLASKR